MLILSSVMLLISPRIVEFVENVENGTLTKIPDCVIGSAMVLLLP
jgi:hypothetical protein